MIIAHRLAFSGPASRETTIEFEGRLRKRNLVKPGHTWSNLVKHGKTWSNMVKHGQTNNGQTVQVLDIVNLLDSRYT